MMRGLAAPPRLAERHGDANRQPRCLSDLKFLEELEAPESE